MKEIVASMMLLGVAGLRSRVGAPGDLWQGKSGLPSANTSAARFRHWVSFKPTE